MKGTFLIILLVAGAVFFTAPGVHAQNNDSTQLYDGNSNYGHDSSGYDSSKYNYDSSGYEGYNSSGYEGYNSSGTMNSNQQQHIIDSLNNMNNPYGNSRYNGAYYGTGNQNKEHVPGTRVPNSYQSGMPGGQYDQVIKPGDVLIKKKPQ